MAQNAIILEISRPLTYDEHVAVVASMAAALPDGVELLHLTATASVAPEVEWLSVPEAASRLSLSQQRVRQLIDEGKLTGRKVGRDWNVTAQSVQYRLASLA